MTCYTKLNRVFPTLCRWFQAHDAPVFNPGEDFSCPSMYCKYDLSTGILIPLNESPLKK